MSKQTTTPYNVKKRTFEIKEDVVKGICHIIEDGKPCKSKTKGRGVCSGHLSYLKRNGLLKEYGTSPLKDTVRKFKINKKPSEKICRLIDEGKPCENTVKSRGICSGHSEYLKSHDLYEKYALTAAKDKIRIFKIKKKTPKGICHIIDGKKSCTYKINARGLCNSHTDYFKRHGLMKEFALPSKKKSVSKTKKSDNTELIRFYTCKGEVMFFRDPLELNDPKKLCRKLTKSRKLELVKLMNEFEDGCIPHDDYYHQFYVHKVLKSKIQLAWALLDINNNLKASDLSEVITKNKKWFIQDA